MTRKRSSPLGLEILMSVTLAVILLPLLTQAAPLQDGTEIQQYTEGCYYNYNHYNEGDRIMTNEPCLNCTCHNRMLMCYLRVCPFTKPIGHDCIVEKREDQCCPIITCPEVPVDVAHHAPEPGTELSIPEKYGCSIDEKFYPEGAQVPSNPNKPCELCYCIKNRTSCLMQECTLHIDGCTPIYNKGSCCPVRYNCDHENDVLELEDHSTTTTVRPTPGFVLTTTMIPAVSTDCVHNGDLYADGASITGKNACEHCYCMRGDIVCAVQECEMPMMAGNGKSCRAVPPADGECCPQNYVCEDDSATTQIIEATTISYAKDESKVTTTSPVKDIHGNVSQEDIQLQTHIDEDDLKEKETTTAQPDHATESKPLATEEVGSGDYSTESEEDQTTTAAPALEEHPIIASSTSAPAGLGSRGDFTNEPSEKTEDETTPTSILASSTEGKLGAATENETQQEVTTAKSPAQEQEEEEEEGTKLPGSDTEVKEATTIPSATHETTSSEETQTETPAEEEKDVATSRSPIAEEEKEQFDTTTIKSATESIQDRIDVSSEAAGKPTTAEHDVETSSTVSPTGAKDEGPIEEAITEGQKAAETTSGPAIKKVETKEPVTATPAVEKTEPATGQDSVTEADISKEQVSDEVEAHTEAGAEPITEADVTAIPAVSKEEEIPPTSATAGEKDQAATDKAHTEGGEEPITEAGTGSTPAISEEEEHIGLDSAAKKGEHAPSTPADEKDKDHTEPSEEAVTEGEGVSEEEETQTVSSEESITEAGLAVTTAGEKAEAHTEASIIDRIGEEEEAATEEVDLLAAGKHKATTIAPAVGDKTEHMPLTEKQPTEVEVSEESTKEESTTASIARPTTEAIKTTGEPSTESAEESITAGAPEEHVTPATAGAKEEAHTESDEEAISEEEHTTLVSVDEKPAAVTESGEEAATEAEITATPSVTPTDAKEETTESSAAVTGIPSDHVPTATADIESAEESVTESDISSSSAVSEKDETVTIPTTGKEEEAETESGEEDITEESFTGAPAVSEKEKLATVGPADEKDEAHTEGGEEPVTEAGIGSTSAVSEKEIPITAAASGEKEEAHTESSEEAITEGGTTAIPAVSEKEPGVTAPVGEKDEVATKPSEEAITEATVTDVEPHISSTPATEKHEAHTVSSEEPITESGLSVTTAGEKDETHTEASIIDRIGEEEEEGEDKGTTIAPAVGDKTEHAVPSTEKEPTEIEVSEEPTKKGETTVGSTTEAIKTTEEGSKEKEKEPTKEEKEEEKETHEGSGEPIEAGSTTIATPTAIITEIEDTDKVMPGVGDQRIVPTITGEAEITTSLPIAEEPVEGAPEPHTDIPALDESSTHVPATVPHDKPSVTEIQPSTEIREETTTDAEGIIASSHQPTLGSRDDFVPTDKPVISEETSSEEIPDLRLPSVIPGEGDCLVGLQTYANNTSVPASNECESHCTCVSSIVVCEPLKCAVPENVVGCIVDEASTNKCCPTYLCGAEIPPRTDATTSAAETEKDISFTTIAPSDVHKPITTGEGERGTTVMTPMDIEIPAASTAEPMSHVKDESTERVSEEDATATPAIETEGKPEKETTDEAGAHTAAPGGEGEETEKTQTAAPVTPGKEKETAGPATKEEEEVPTTDKTAPAVEVAEKETSDETKEKEMTTAVPIEDKRTTDGIHSTTVPPIGEKEQETTEVAAQTVTPAIEEEQGTTAHPAVPTVEVQEEEITDETASTVAPAGAGQEKESSDETKAHTPAPSSEAEEQATTDDFALHAAEKDKEATTAPAVEKTPAHTGAPSETIDDTKDHSAAPSSEEEKGTTQAHTGAPAIESGERATTDAAVASTTVPSIGETEKETIDDTGVPTAAPGIEEAEKETTAEPSAHTAAPATAGGEKESTEAESVSATTPATIGQEKGTTDESETHTLIPDIEGEEKIPTDGIEDHTTAPGKEEDTSAPSAEGQEKETTDATKIHTEEEETTGQPPAQTGAPADKIDTHTAATPTEGEKEETQEGKETTAAPATDETATPSSTPSVIGQDKETQTVAPSHEGGEKEAQTPIPPVEGEEEKEAQTSTPAIEGEEEKQDHTAAPAIEGEEKETTPEIEVHTDAPADTTDEIAVHTTAPTVEPVTHAGPSSEKDQGTTVAHTAAPSVGEEPKETSVETATHTAAPTVEGEEKETIEETVAPTAVPALENQEKPTSEEPKEKEEEATTDEIPAHTEEPILDSAGKRVPEAAIGSSTVSSIDEHEREKTDAIAAHTETPVLEGEEKETTDKIPPVVTQDKETTDAPEAQTAASAILEEEKEITGEPGAPTSAPGIEGEEKGTTPESEAHTPAPVQPTDEAAISTITPVFEGMEKEITEEAVQKEASTEVPAHTTPAVEGQEKETTDEAATPTAAPTLEGQEKKTTDTTKTHTEEEETTAGTPAETGAPAKETTDETAAYTLAPPVEEEEETTDFVMLVSGEDKETTAAPAIDETTAQTITPSTVGHDQEAIDDTKDHTTAPVGEKEEVSPSQTGAPTVETEEKDTVASTTITPIHGLEKESTDDTTAQTAAPGIAEEEEPVSHTLRPSVTAQEKETTEDAVAHTAAPAVEGEDKEPSTVTSGIEREEDHTSLHTTTPAIPGQDKETTAESVAHTSAPDTTTEEKKPEEIETQTPAEEITDESHTVAPIDEVSQTVVPVVQSEVTDKSPAEDKDTELTAFVDEVTGPTDEIIEEESEETTKPMESLDHKVTEIGGPKLHPEVEEEKKKEEEGEGSTEGTFTDKTTTAAEESAIHTIVPAVEDKTTQRPAVSIDLEPIDETAESVESEEEGTTQHSAIDKTPEESAGGEVQEEVSTEKAETSEIGEKGEEPTSEISTERITPLEGGKPIVTEAEHIPEQATEKIEPVEAEKIEPTAESSTEKLEPIDEADRTTVHPLFPHIGTTVGIDSRIDAANTTLFTTPAEAPTTAAAPITHYPPPPPIYGQQPPQYPHYTDDEYDEETPESYGPGTCRYGGKLYVSAQQIPRDDPCDFCFCFRSDIICLQQSCPPPIPGCHEEPISGFCCPRYECPVSMATVLNITTSTTTTSTTLPPHFLGHHYNGAVQRGCQMNGRSYKVGEKMESTSGPCIKCTCGGDGKMECDPQACQPEPIMQQMMAVVAAGRKR